MKSKCCKADLTIFTGSEGTNHWVCARCGQPADPMQNEPQLSAEMEERFDEEFTKGDDWIAPNMKASYIKHFLATVLEEQRLGYIAEVEKLTDNEEDDTTAWLYNSAINKVLAILNGKDTNE